MKRLLPLFFLLAAPASAQDVLADSAYQRLDAEIWALESPKGPLMGNAYRALDSAVEQGRYQRADSVITLVTARLLSTIKHPILTIFWPSVGDHVVLGLLREDPSVLDLLRDDGAWQQPRISAALAPRPYGFDEAQWTAVVRPGVEDERRRLIDSRRFVYPRDALLLAIENSKDDLLPALTEAGAKEEQLAFASLAVSALIENQFLFFYHHPYITDEQERLNNQADAFLLAYPDTPYELFVRRYVRKRYSSGSTALGASFSFGDSSVGGNYGNLFSGRAMFEFTADFRISRVHIGITIFEVSSGARNRMDIGDQTVEQDEGYGIGYVGPEAGPRLVLGPLDLQPYISAGLIDVSPFKNSEDEIEHGSTWDPGRRFGYGYGLKVDIPVLSGQLTRLAVRARAGWIAPNLGTIDGVDLGGQVAFFTLGGSILFQGYERVE